MEKGTSYFESNQTIKRIMDEIYKKWRKTKKMNGFVVLYETSSHERMDLESILNRPFHNSYVKFRISEFQYALKEKEFHEVDMDELFYNYFKEQDIINKMKFLNYSKMEFKDSHIFSEIIDYLALNDIDSSIMNEWIQHIMEYRNLWHNLVVSEFEKDKEKTLFILGNISRALIFLKQNPKDKIGLDELSERITNDPCYFAYNNLEGRLLLYAFCFIHKCVYPRDLESKWELFYLSGITIDNMKNVATAYGVKLYTKEGLHRAYEEFNKKKEEYAITLTSLNRIVKADSPRKKVYVVENPDVFLQLCKRAKDTDISLMCTSGKLKAPSLILIHLLCESNCQVYYSGNIDPEGLLRFDMLIRKVNGKVVPWRYGISDYFSCISDKKVKDASLLKLDRIHHPVLKKVANQLMLHKCVGCREKLIDQLWKDIDLQLLNT